MNTYKDTVNQLFALFQEGSWDKAATLFDQEAQIIPQYGHQISSMTVPQFIENCKSGRLSKVGLPVYLDRKVTMIGVDGFVEQHQTMLKIHGREIRIPVCLVGKFSSSGKILRLEEYLDPTPIALALQG